MSKTAAFIKAARLRTLPLSFSAVITGSSLAVFGGKKEVFVIVLCLTTTLFLQILSNLANDYGDHIKGTDNEQRVGPSRTMQSGEISRSEMKTGILICVLLSLVSGIWLVYEGTKGMGRMILYFSSLLVCLPLPLRFFIQLEKKLMVIMD